MSEEKKISATIILEMMGRPKEHLKETMKNFLGKIDAEKGVKVENKKIHEPKLVEQKDKEGKIIQMPAGKEIYSTFAELDLAIEHIFDLIRVVFVYMPSHVEVTRPSEFKMPNFDIASVLNEITKKLHQYDAIAKNALMQNQILANKLASVQQQIQQQVGGNITQQRMPIPSLSISPEKGKKARKKSSKKKKDKIGN